MGLVRQFLGHVLPGVLRPLRIMGNQIVGFFFLAFAAMFGLSILRNLKQLSNAHIVIGGAFALWMAYFGVTSFLKARKISRS